MGLRETKQTVLSWKDFYGGDIINAESVKTAKNKKDIYDALQEHRGYMEIQFIDALQDLDSLIEDLDLY